MPFVHENVKVELFPGTPSPIVYLSENDVGDTIVFELVYKGQPVNVPNGSVVKFKGIKKDGLGFTVNSSNVSGNVVSFVVSGDMTSCSGVVESEISITLSNNKHGTCNVILIVEKNPHSDGTQDGSYPQIVSEMRELVEQIEGDAETASNAANTAVAAKNSALEIQQDVHQYTASVIDDWLDNHPEATTTVQNNSITDAKLISGLRTAVKNSTLYMAAINMESGSTTLLGDCTVFYGDVNGIVDFGNDSNVTALLSFLLSHNIISIDFVIISHYHGDHVTSNFGTALNKLISGGIDFSNCTFYLPHLGIDWTRFQGTDDVQSSKETVVKNAITSHNFTYVEPQNKTTIRFTDYTSIQFLNIGDYDDYYDCKYNGRGELGDYTIYNNFSMISIINHCGAVFVMSGDIHELAQSKNYSYINRCDVYKVEHHGVNSVVNNEWIAKIVPQYIVVNKYAKDSYNTVELLQAPIEKYCSKGSKFLFNDEDDCIILSVGGVLYNQSGACHDLSKVLHLGGGYRINQYVDLNSLLDVGEYYCPNAADIEYLYNCPASTAFRMVVENPRGINSGSYIYRLQIIHQLNSEITFIRYVRASRGGSILAGEWAKIVPIRVTEILSGTDLNDCTDVREYYCPMNATAQTLLNCPVSNAFRMVVENPRGIDVGSSIYRVQKLISTTGDFEYFRHFTIAGSTATFGDWHSMNADVVYPTFNTSESSHYTPGYDYITRMGKICIVKLEGTTGDKTTGWTTIFTDCPKADIGAFAANILTNSGAIVRARVSTSGELQMHISSDDAANKSIGTTFVYVCK